MVVLLLLSLSLSSFWPAQLLWDPSVDPRLHIHFRKLWQRSLTHSRSAFPTRTSGTILLPRRWSSSALTNLAIGSTSIRLVPTTYHRRRTTLPWRDWFSAAPSPLVFSSDGPCSSLFSHPIFRSFLLKNAFQWCLHTRGCVFDLTISFVVEMPSFHTPWDPL